MKIKVLITPNLRTFYIFNIFEVFKLLLKLKIDTIFLSVKGQEQLFFQN